MFLPVIETRLPFENVPWIHLVFLVSKNTRIGKCNYTTLTHTYFIIGTYGCILMHLQQMNIVNIVTKGETYQNVTCELNPKQ